LLYGLAEEHCLEVIEDAGPSLGARFGESRIGRSPCACVLRIPFDGSTAIGRVALVALPGAWAERFAPHAKDARASDACCAAARRELAVLEDTISERRANASYYSSELAPYDAFRVPVTPEDGLSTYPGYLLRLTRFARTSAADLARLLGESGIETRRIRLDMGERELGSLPCTGEALHTSLLIPVGPGLDDRQREHVLDSIFGYAIG
jgi:dTDP-4-amino-4,6-dideoxygalactose transaminase